MKISGHQQIITSAWWQLDSKTRRCLCCQGDLMNETEMTINETSRCDFNLRANRALTQHSIIQRPVHL